VSVGLGAGDEIGERRLAIRARDDAIEFDSLSSRGDLAARLVDVTVVSVSTPPGRGVDR